eukprot:519140-Pyramimonas_sp.AAC.1
MVVATCMSGALACPAAERTMFLGQKSSVRRLGHNVPRHVLSRGAAGMPFPLHAKAERRCGVGRKTSIVCSKKDCREEQVCQEQACNLRITLDHLGGCLAQSRTVASASGNSSRQCETSA